MIKSIPETRVLQACRTLFGSDVYVSRDFLAYLQPSGAKSAFRKMAKESHPDLFAREPADIQTRQSALFRDVVQAYELLREFFQLRSAGVWMPADRFSTADLRPQQARAEAQASRFYCGPMPVRLLEIGIYLYYRGKIPYHALIGALVWQRGQRPVMGSIAKRWNWLDEASLREVLALRGKKLRFGEKAVELGYLTPFQVKALLWFQRSQQERIGTYFVQRGFLTAGEMELLVAEMRQHNERIRAAAARPFDRN